MDILKLNKDELLELNPIFNRKMDAEEIFHIFSLFDGYWGYNYQVAEEKPGLHALLKSGKHSDGFINSRIVLPNENICRILAWQLTLHWLELNLTTPDYVIGIPDGATKLGQYVAQYLGAKNVEMIKNNGRICLESEIKKGRSLLFVEDFCTRGTGFVEAVRSVYEKQANIYIIPIELVIINRGGMENIVIDDIGRFKIVAAATRRITDWDDSDCVLCRKYGSIAVKPKIDELSWQRIKTSQV
jgi:hypothetical protein